MSEPTAELRSKEDMQFLAGDAVWSLREIRSAIEELTAAVKSKKSVVPMFIFIPTTELRSDQFDKIGAWMRHEWAKMSGEEVPDDGPA